MKKVSELKEELADIARQRVLIHNELRRLRSVKAGECQVKDDCCEALDRMTARTAEIKAELNAIAEAEGRDFERVFMKAAKEILSSAKYAQIIKRTEQLRKR